MPGREEILKNKGFTTKILHSDRFLEQTHGELVQPVTTSVAYGYEDSRDLAAVFQGRQKGYAYGRQSTPSLTALEQIITGMEGGTQTVCFATGMSAIGSTLLALLRQGDHMISSSFLFGNTNSLFNTISTQGIDVTFVDPTRMENVRDAIRPETRLVFVETIANPITQIADMARIGDLCEEKGLIYVVDNTTTSPVLFRPVDVKASLIINSLTKSIAGHGRALGGAVTETGRFPWQSFPNIYDNYRNRAPGEQGITQIRKKGLRDFGAALAPEAAHALAHGAETLALRMERTCHNAMTIARTLNAHDKVKTVNYPGLPGHAQHKLATELFKNYGYLLSFELQEGIDCFDFLNRLELVISSSNLGDNRTLAIPVAHTIFYEMGAERRKSMGIPDSMIRLSVGIEDTDDLLKDFRRALG